MENIATCPNGHNYDANTYDRCPYCPNSEEKTVVNPGNADDVNPTIPNQADQAAKTQIVEPGGDKTIPMQNMRSDEKNFVSQGTRIISPDSETLKGESSENRKVMAFLISYDINPNGKSYPVFEGKNLLGADPECDIVVPADSGISGKHLTILYRSGMFRFRDEFSTNGTWVNGEMKEDGKLEGNCVIKVGATRFLFIPVPLNLL